MVRDREGLAPFILNKPDNVWFNVNMMQKDLLLAQELGREYNVPLTSVAIANETLTTARAMGLTDAPMNIPEIIQAITPLQEEGNQCSTRC